MKATTKNAVIAIAIVAGTVTGVHLIYSIITYLEKERALGAGKEYSVQTLAGRGRIIDIAGNEIAGTDTLYDEHFDPMAWGESRRDTYHGGIIIGPSYVRKYPYGSLAIILCPLMDDFVIGFEDQRST